MIMTHVHRRCRRSLTEPQRPQAPVRLALLDFDPLLQKVRNKVLHCCHLCPANGLGEILDAVLAVVADCEARVAENGTRDRGELARDKFDNR